MMESGVMIGLFAVAGGLAIDGWKRAGSGQLAQRINIIQWIGVGLVTGVLCPLIFHWTGNYAYAVIAGILATAAGAQAGNYAYERAQEQREAERLKMQRTYANNAREREKGRLGQTIEYHRVYSDAEVRGDSSED